MSRVWRRSGSESICKRSRARAQPRAVDNPSLRRDEQGGLVARDRGPKHKLSRREGVNLTGTTSPSLAAKLSNPPNARGRGRTRVMPRGISPKLGRKYFAGGPPRSADSAP